MTNGNTELLPTVHLTMVKRSILSIQMMY